MIYLFFTEEINNDLKRISEWAFQWKMMFNPDLTKQAQEVIFYRKIVKFFYSQVFFNEVPVERSVSQKHLGLHLDQKLDFSKHINEKISKAQKGISVIKKLYNILPRNALLTIYKPFVRPHLDYGVISYMINQTTRVYQTKSKRLSIMLPLQSQTQESAKLRALRAKNVLVCQRGFRAFVLTCQRVLRVYLLTYLRALRAYVLTCQRVFVLTCSRDNVPSMLTCSRANVSCVLTCQCVLVLMCSSTNVPCVLMCSCVNAPSSRTLIHI